MTFTFSHRLSTAVATLCVASLLLTACNGATKNKVEDKSATAKKPAKSIKTVSKEPAPEAAKAAVKAPTPKTDKKAQQFAETPFKISFASADGAVGKASSTTVKIVPLDGYKMNKDFPNSLKLDANKVAKFKKTDFASGDAQLSDQLLSFGVDFTASTAGKLDLTATANFSVCNERVCKLFRGEKLAWAVSVK